MFCIVSIATSIALYCYQCGYGPVWFADARARHESHDSQHGADSESARPSGTGLTRAMPLLSPHRDSHLKFCTHIAATLACGTCSAATGMNAKANWSTGPQAASGQQGTHWHWPGQLCQQ